METNSHRHPPRPSPDGDHPAQSLEPPVSTRKIIHVDMDAYYASVEILDRPELAHVPLIVGGSPQGRGVVSTANYEARKYGIRSAMACSIAYRLCPKAVFVRPRFERYKEISLKIREIFSRHTNLVEPLSLDEAYLDVTHTSSGKYASVIAREIREQVFKETGLTCSAGVGPNKLIAKIASEYRKPNGLTVIPPEQVLDFMAPLTVRKIHGVGPATEKRLHALGIKTCSDIRAFGIEALEARLGNWGTWLYEAAHGRDQRVVETSWERKSFGREETFGKDKIDFADVEQELRTIVTNLAEYLKKRNFIGRTITLKIKYHNFESITRSRTIAEATQSSDVIWQTVNELLHTKTEVGRRPVRLVGVSLKNLSETA